MGQPISTLREFVGSIPGTLKAIPDTVKEAIPDSVTAIPATVVNAIPDSVKAIPGTVLAVPGKLLAYPQAILERLKALLPGSLKSLPGRLKKEDNNVPEIAPEVQADKMVPTEVAPPKPVAPEMAIAHTTTESLMELAEELAEDFVEAAVDARRDEIEYLDHVLPATVVEPMQKLEKTSWQIGYVSLFFAAAFQYNMVTLKPKSFADFYKFKDDWPTHFLWGAGNGACACLAASLFPPYTKWLVILLVGCKWAQELLLFLARSRGWIEDYVSDDEEELALI